MKFHIATKYWSILANRDGKGGAGFKDGRGVMFFSAFNLHLVASDGVIASTPTPACVVGVRTYYRMLVSK